MRAKVVDFVAKTRAREMFEDAPLVLQDHLSVINAVRRSTKNTAELNKDHGGFNDDVKGKQRKVK